MSKRMICTCVALLIAELGGCSSNPPSGPATTNGATTAGAPVGSGSFPSTTTGAPAASSTASQMPVAGSAAPAQTATPPAANSTNPANPGSAQTGTAGTAGTGGMAGAMPAGTGTGTAMPQGGAGTMGAGTGMMGTGTGGTAGMTGNPADMTGNPAGDGSGAGDAMGTGTGTDTGDPADQTDPMTMGDGGDGMATGGNGSELTGTLGALGPVEPVQAGFATTNGLETLIYLSSAPLTCAQMMTMGTPWLRALPAGSQVIEIVVRGTASVGTTQVGFLQGEINYAEGSKSSSFEVNASSGSITFTQAERGGVHEGMISATYPMGMLSGTFHAEWCEGGQEY